MIMHSGSTAPALAALLCCVIMAGPSCNKDDRPELCQLNHFVGFDIQPGLNTFETHIYRISPVPSQLDAQLAARGRTRDEVEVILPQSAVLGGVFQDINLDFIHRISVHVFDPFNPNDKVEFFYLDPVPVRNKTAIQLFPGIADVTAWFERPFFGVEIRLDYRQVTPSFIPMRLEFTMSVKGKN